MGNYIYINRLIGKILLGTMPFFQSHLERLEFYEADSSSRRLFPMPQNVKECHAHNYYPVGWLIDYVLNKYL